MFSTSTHFTLIQWEGLAHSKEDLITRHKPYDLGHLECGVYSCECLASFSKVCLDTHRVTTLKETRHGDDPLLAKVAKITEGIREPGLAGTFVSSKLSFYRDCTSSAKFYPFMSTESVDTEYIGTDSAK